MEISFTQIFLANLSIAFGAVLQASTGMASGIFVAPVLALIHLSLLPGPVMFASLSLSVLMALRERKSIYWFGLPQVIFGVFFGSLLGITLMNAFPHSNLGAVYGLIILIAIGMSLLGWVLPIQKRFSFLVGVLSSFMGITAAVGGVVIALYYQNLKGPQIRATLGMTYLFGAFVMMTVLHFSNRFDLEHLTLGIYLIPGMVFGFLLAPKLSVYLDRGNSKKILLGLASLSALLLIIKSFF